MSSVPTSGVPQSGAELGDLYESHAERVLRYAMRCVGHRDLAEDLTSEAFLALLRHRGRVDAAQLPAWLFAVVRNRAIDHWRRQALEGQRLAEWGTQAASSEPPSSALHDTLESNPALKAVHRSCLLLHYRDGMTREEIAAQLGLTPLQVKGHLQYSLRLLRKQTPQAGRRRRANSAAEPEKLSSVLASHSYSS